MIKTSILIITSPDKIKEFNELVKGIHFELQARGYSHYVTETIIEPTYYFHRVAYPDIEVIAIGDYGNNSLERKKELLKEKAKGECVFYDDNINWFEENLN